MGVKKGQVNNPAGRPKGATNRATADLRKAVNELLDNNWEKIQEDIDELEAKDRLAFLEKLLSYTLPKLQSVEVHADMTAKLEGMSEDQLNTLIDHILNQNTK
jgi:hypothetical protein